MGKFLGLISAIYPSKEFEIEFVFDAWYMLLGDMDYSYAVKALKKYAINERFRPAPCDIHKNIKEIKEKEKEKIDYERRSKFISNIEKEKIDYVKNYNKKDEGKYKLKDLLARIGVYGQGERGDYIE
jgi:hypothetical protein